MCDATSEEQSEASCDLDKSARPQATAPGASWPPAPKPDALQASASDENENLPGEVEESLFAKIGHFIWGVVAGGIVSVAVHFLLANCLIKVLGQNFVDKFSLFIFPLPCLLYLWAAFRICRSGNKYTAVSFGITAVLILSVADGTYCSH